MKMNSIEDKYEIDRNFDMYALYAREYVRGKRVASKRVQSWDYKPMPSEVCLCVALDAIDREIEVMLTMDSQQIMNDTEMLIGRQFKRTAPKSRIEYELVWEF
jgi:hypothetical protein